MQTTNPVGGIETTVKVLDPLFVCQELCAHWTHTPVDAVSALDILSTNPADRISAECAEATF